MSLFFPGLVVAWFIAQILQILAETAAGRRLLLGMGLGLGGSVSLFLALGAALSTWGVSGPAGPAGRALLALLLLGTILLQHVLGWFAFRHPRPWRRNSLPPNVLPFRRPEAPQMVPRPGPAVHDPALALPVPGTGGEALALAHPTGADGLPLGPEFRDSWVRAEDAWPPDESSTADHRAQSVVRGRAAAALLAAGLGLVAVTAAWMPLVEGLGPFGLDADPVLPALADAAAVWLAAALGGVGLVIAFLDDRWWWRSLIAAGVLLGSGVLATVLAILTA